MTAIHVLEISRAPNFAAFSARQNAQANSVNYRRSVGQASILAPHPSDGIYPFLSTAIHGIHTRVATALHELEAAADLVRRRYAWRGYEVKEIATPEHDSPSARPTELTLVTGGGSAPVGTITLRSDGPDGLQADSCYRRELDAARAKGQRVGEVTRLALESEVDSKPVLASMFYVAQWLLQFHHEVTNVFVEVNPRHAPFYRRTLGFVVAARERFCERVGAPGVLLQVPIDVLGHRVGAFRNRVLGSFGETAPAAA